MGFAGRIASREQLRHVLISALVADILVVPILGTFLFVHQRPVRWSYLLAAVACIAATGIYLGVSMARRRRKGFVDLDPMVTWLTFTAALVSLSCIEIAAKSPLGFYKPALVVGVMYASIIGDIRMRCATVAVAIGLVGWTTWAEGVRGAPFATVVIIYASVFVVVTWLMGRTFDSLRTLLAARDTLRSLTETLDGTDLLENGIERGLPLVADALSAESVAVYLATDEPEPARTVTRWPTSGPAADDPTAIAGFCQALETNQVAFDDNWSFIPIGYAYGGQLLLACHHERPQHEALLMKETAETVGAIFLKMSSQAAYVAGLQLQTRTDALTGLANRRALKEHLEAEVVRSGRIGIPLSVAMIDLDHFKAYNDTYGHPAGDVLLRAVSALMGSRFRGQDLVARYGGEEFCVVLTGCSAESAAIAIEDLLVEARSSEGLAGITFSAGIACWRPSEDAAALIERADQALYLAKAEGRNRIVTAPPTVLRQGDTEPRR